MKKSAPIMPRSLKKERRIKISRIYSYDESPVTNLFIHLPSHMEYVLSDYMKHVLLILFLFLFLPTASFAKTYPYNGKTALLSDSKKAGGRHDWLRLCAGKYSKHAREIEKEVKKLSTPDYKLYRKGISEKRAKNYIWASGCKENGAGSMRWMTNYVKNFNISLYL